MTTKVIFLTTGTGPWTVPTDWTNTNKVEVIGGGAGGRNGSSGGGGGAGAYSCIFNITSLTPGQTGVYYSVGVAGIGQQTGSDTWFGSTSFATSLVGAKCGVTTSTVTGGLGGDGGSGRGDIRYSGGNGGLGNASVLTGGGGGGAGGPGGTGGNGGAGDATAAAADAGGGGGSGGGLTTPGSTGGAGTASSGAGATNASGGGPGGAGNSGAGTAAVTATGMWTSTHAADGTTPSVVGAATGGGGGGAGSAGGVGGAAGAFGGGGGAGSVGGTAGKGVIIISYLSSIPPTTLYFENAYDWGDNFTLTNAGKTVQRQGTIQWYAGTRTGLGRSTGKYIFKITCDAVGANFRAGVATAAWTGQRLGGDLESVGLSPDGDFEMNGQDASPWYTMPAALTAGSVRYMAFDFDLGRMWIRDTSAWFPGDPATVAGYPLDGSAGIADMRGRTWYPAFGTDGSEVVSKITVDGTAPGIAYPPGFLSWEGGTGMTAANDFWVNQAGTWKQAEPWVNHAGTWKLPSGVWVNDAGTWKLVFGTA